MIKYFLLGVLLFIPQIMFAQDTTNALELARTDIKLQKKAILSENMQLTEAQAKIFWRIYNDYEYQLTKIGDKIVDNVDEFAKHFDTMTEDKAEDILDQSFDNHEEELKLLKKATKEIADKLGYKVAIRFYQIESLLNTVIDLQILSSIPLLETE